MVSKVVQNLYCNLVEVFAPIDEHNVEQFCLDDQTLVWWINLFDFSYF